MDRRAARRAAAKPLSRRTGPGAPRAQIRPRGSLRADGPARCAQCLSAADRAQDDAPGQRIARPLRPSDALGEDILEWGRAALGVDINEFYGQTEANLVVGNCASLFAIRPGSMGRAIPGHGVAVVSADGRPLPPGESGIVAVRRPDPVLFLGYWNDPEASRAKFAGEWLLTGDIAIADEDGYFWYKGREDDLISSGGYRIGPTDIEECLGKHPAVVMAAVVGRPDPVRGEIVKAFVVPRPEAAAGPALAEELRAFVASRLAPYQAPREIAFVSELPLTATGKILRRELRRREQ